MANADVENAFKKHDKQVRYLADSFAASSGLDADDLHQEGRIALMEACESFDPSRGYSFWTYARRCVIGEMHNYVKRELRIPITEETVDVPSDASDVEDVVIARDLLRRIAQSLSAKEMAIVLLRYEDEQPVKDSAEALGMSKRSALRLSKSAAERAASLGEKAA